MVKNVVFRRLVEESKRHGVIVSQNTQSPDQGAGDGIESAKTEYSSGGQELTWLVLILVLGLSLRLLFITFFPTTPFSDFLSLLNFAIVFRDDWMAKNAWQWRFFSPGLPFILSVILRFVHGSPEVIGRWTTALITGLTPALPYLLW